MSSGLIISLRLFIPLTIILEGKLNISSNVSILLSLELDFFEITLLMFSDSLRPSVALIIASLRLMRLLFISILTLTLRWSNS